VTSAGAWCKKKLGYQFSDNDLLTRALTHRSASADHNERLEFLGDAVLGLSVARALFSNRPDAREGTLSRYRSGLVRRETLAEVAAETGLGDWIEMGAGERRSGGNQRMSVLADGLEAVLGAIYLDGGYERANEVILQIFAERLANLPAEEELIDPKTRLQEYLQARQQPPPAYSLVDSAGAAHARTFRVVCAIAALGLEISGTGTSRRRAEQAAAETALEQFSDA
jgi:ribonuclease-3